LSTTYRPSNIDLTEVSESASVNTGIIAASKVNEEITDNSHFLRSSMNKSSNNTTQRPAASTNSGARP
jgi:hypothetical protein